jgi:glutamate-1-semialdehyde 2,1-aminomutase
VSGRGHRLTDADGHELIDLQANMSALVHGHSHPAIVAAIEQGLRDGLSFGLPTESEVRLASHLTARVRALERVRFANSGTEAVMTALRTARAFTGRDAIVRFEGCYHGSADAVRTGSRGVPPSDDVIVVPWGDAHTLEAVMSERVAALVIDLMPSRAGLVPAEPAFAAAAQSLTRACGALLLVDEVVTFRLASGGLHSVMGVEPDLVALGKTIGGGLPVGAFGGRADVMAVLDPRTRDAVEHGGTFNANPTVMRAGLAALELLDAAAIARINALGDALRERMRGLDYRVNGVGSLLRVMDEDVWWPLYRAGVLVAHNGLACISTTMDEQTVDELAARFEAAR